MFEIKFTITPWKVSASTRRDNVTQRELWGSLRHPAIQRNKGIQKSPLAARNNRADKSNQLLISPSTQNTPFHPPLISLFHLSQKLSHKYAATNVSFFKAPIYRTQSISPLLINFISCSLPWLLFWGFFLFSIFCLFAARVYKMKFND